MSGLPQSSWDRIAALTASVPAPVGIQAEFRAASSNLRASHLRALAGLGVARATLAEFNRDYGFGIVRAVEHPSEPGLYALTPDGADHLVLPVFDNCELVDLVAFRSRSPNGWLLRTGLGWALGLERGLEPHAWGDGVSLAVSPLEWLQGGARGLCVLDWDAPEVSSLRDLPHLVCSNELQASALRKALARPARLPTISIQEPLRYAA